jgi:hypothetical protein
MPAVPVLAVCLAIGFGCTNPFSSGDNGGGNGGGPDYDRETPGNLLNFFIQSYVNENIADYDVSMDDNFLFHFTKDVADELGLPAEEPWWGKTEDVTSTNNMFAAPRVTEILMSLEAETDWEEWNVAIGDSLYETLGARFKPDIKVTVEEQGEEPRTHWVHETRIWFYVKEDDTDSNLWEIIKIQEEEINPGAFSLSAIRSRHRAGP